ncbi:hypothetical protein D6B99_09770 [Arachidicoccus soli]|uniref:PepSY domain-containing protein n=2 Tax=Arachidicoccus soli TaxID=2341117 RepID=A0A386HQY3_9BACT|nr:hypothetical protein D6B99_09770 [Arachidicoccus soli]
MKKKIYKWHRTLSIIIAFPVLIWAMSGFLHPIMTDIRPQIATQQTPALSIDSSMMKVPLNKALKENDILSFFNFRIVSMDDTLYYQVKKTAAAAPEYLSAFTGKLLTNGDKLYAIYLAEHFLTNGKTKVSIASVDTVNDFTTGYNVINKLLPVYRVIFNRADGIRIYVDTQQSRFSYASDKRRAWLNSAFIFLHTWSWMDNFSLLKVIIITALMLMTMFTACFGLYIFFTTKSKNVLGNKVVKRRRIHRYTAVFAALFTLLFTFSGCVHILSSLAKDDRGKTILSQRISTDNAGFDIARVQTLIHHPLCDLSFVQMNQQLYLRVNASGEGMDKDLMMRMSVTVPKIYFIHLSDYRILPDGDKLYAIYLANNYLHKNINSSETVIVSKFGYDYDFSDKVLPVWQVVLNHDNSNTVFVETATGKLRKESSRIEKFDAFCFAFFHKHEFMAWGGKNLKDFSTMFWVFAQIVMIIFGLIIYFKRTKKKT